MARSIAGKSLEEVLAGLTGQQIRALALKAWSALGGLTDGEENVRRLLAGDIKFKIEELVPKPPVLMRKPSGFEEESPLVATFVGKLVVKPYQANSIADAIDLGEYDGVYGNPVEAFSGDDLGLTEEIGVDLFQYNRNWLYDEVLAWAKDNGNKKPILLKHILGIGIQHLEERNMSIVGIGSAQHGWSLCLHDSSGRHYLTCTTVAGRWTWNQGCLVGFLSEPTSLNTSHEPDSDFDPLTWPNSGPEWW